MSERSEITTPQRASHQMGSLAFPIWRVKPQSATQIGYVQSICQMGHLGFSHLQSASDLQIGRSHLQIGRRVQSADGVLGFSPKKVFSQVPISHLQTEAATLEKDLVCRPKLASNPICRLSRHLQIGTFTRLGPTYILEYRLQL